MVELEPVKQKMRKARVRTADEAEAQGIITGNEAAAMREALVLVREVCAVDDFSHEEIVSRSAQKSAPAKPVVKAMATPAKKPAKKPNRKTVKKSVKKVAKAS